MPPPRPSHLFLQSAALGGSTSITAVAAANISITHNNVLVSGPPPLPPHHTITYTPPPALPPTANSAAPAPPPLPPTLAYNNANHADTLLLRSFSPSLSSSPASSHSVLSLSPPAAHSSLSGNGSGSSPTPPEFDSSRLALQTVAGWLPSSSSAGSPSDGQTVSPPSTSVLTNAAAEASPSFVSYRAPPSIITYRQSFSHAVSPSSAHSPAVPVSPANAKHGHSVSLSQSGFSPFPLGPPSPSPSTPTPTPHRADHARAVESDALDGQRDGLTEDSTVRTEQSQYRPSQQGGASYDDDTDNDDDETPAAHVEQHTHSAPSAGAEDTYGVLGIASPMLSASASPPLSSSLSAPSAPSATAVVPSQSQSLRASTHHRRRSSFRHHLYLDEEAPDETPIGRMTIAEEESRNSLSSNSSSSNTSHLSSSSNPYERLVDEVGQVKLANILSLYETKLPNPFQGDWAPVPPPNVTVDTLVGCSLAQFNKPIRQVVRDLVQYVQYQPRKIRLLDYEVDEPVKARARLEQAREQQQGGRGIGKSRLQDIFQSPTNAASDASSAKRAPSESSPFAEPSPSASAVSPTAAGSSGTQRRFMDVEDGRYEDLGAAADLVDSSLLSVTLDDVQTAIRREQASSYREGLFWRFSPCYVFDPSSSADLTLVKRQSVNFWSSASQHACRFLVSIQSLRLSLGNIEPLYCTLAVFDLKSEQRCSDNFDFDLNDSSLLTGQMAVEVSFPDPLTLCKHAIFSLTDGHTHEQTVLALRVERVLQGDPADMDIYFKTKVRTPAELHALSKKSRQNLVHLAEFRQPFGWAMLPLFESGGELKVSHGSLRMDRLFQQTDSLRDELFIALLKEALPDGGRSKHKQFPASFFECRIDQLEPNCLPPNRVDPSCIPLKNTSSVWPVQQLAEYNVAADFVALNSNSHAAVAQPIAHSHSHSRSFSHSQQNSTSVSQPALASPSAAAGSMAICKEVLDFTSSFLPIPADGFVNLLYVYPEFIKFENKYRNIACRVQVRSSDAAVDGGEAHKIILGKSSTASFCTAALTQVNYHKRQVTPQDEVKVMLPLHLSSQFHLFFTFYKVSCKVRTAQHTHTHTHTHASSHSLRGCTYGDVDA